MLKRLFVGIGAALVVGVMAPTTTRAQAPEGQDATIQGTVVDVTCKFTKGISGDAHRRCGEMCAAAGLPLAIMADDGTLYFPLGNEAGQAPSVDLKRHVDHKVTVTGKVYSTSGGKGIVITNLKM